MRFNRIFFVFILFFCLPLFAKNLSAGTVSELTVIPGASGSDPCDDGTGDFQFCLDTAAADGAENILNVQPGSYNLSAALTYAPSNEDFPLTIQNATETLPVVDGANMVSCLILNLGAFSGANADVRIDGLVFQNCLGTANLGAGALVFGVDPDVSIDNCSFLNNQASGDLAAGGVLVLLLGSGNASLSTNLFQNNSYTGTSTSSAAGVLVGINSGNISLVGNTFENNDNEVSFGASVLATPGGIDVAQNRFSDNDGSIGGALGISSSGSETLSIDSNFFFHNTGSIGGGGVFVSKADGDTLLTNNIFYKNEAGIDPSGLLIMRLEEPSPSQTQGKTFLSSITPSSTIHLKTLRVACL